MDDKHDGPFIRHHGEHEKRVYRFLVLCMILMVTFFGLIHTVVYFGDLTGAAIRLKNSKAMIVLP
jgi:hypothetical protein